MTHNCPQCPVDPAIAEAAAREQQVQHVEQMRGQCPHSKELKR